MIRATLQEDMSAEEVVELAAAGALGLEPFDISPSTVRELRAEAERERPTNGGPKTELDRTRAIAEATIARVEALGERATAKDLNALRQATFIVQDAERQAEKRAARERLSRPAERKGCKYLAQEDNREVCTCSKPCFAAWLVNYWGPLQKAKAEGRPEPCLGFAFEGEDTCSTAASRSQTTSSFTTTRPAVSVWRGRRPGSSEQGRSGLDRATCPPTRTEAVCWYPDTRAPPRLEPAHRWLSSLDTASRSDLACLQLSGRYGSPPTLEDGLAAEAPSTARTEPSVIRPELAREGRREAFSLTHARRIAGARALE